MKLLMTCFAVLLASCTTYNAGGQLEIPAGARIVIMPLSNHSGTPMAAEQVEQILAVSLFKRGIDAKVYETPEGDSVKAIFDPGFRRKQAQIWLNSLEVDYVITGSVQEWRYKSGLDSEPAVGLTLELISMPDNRVVWRASGSRSGWGRESLSGTGRDVADHLVEGIQFQSDSDGVTYRTAPQVELHHENVVPGKPEVAGR